VGSVLIFGIWQTSIPGRISSVIPGNAATNSFSFAAETSSFLILSASLYDFGRH